MIRCRRRVPPSAPAGEVEVVGGRGAGAGPVAAHERGVAGQLPAVEQAAREPAVPHAAPGRDVPGIVDDEVVELGEAVRAFVPLRACGRSGMKSVPSLMVLANV